MAPRAARRAAAPPVLAAVVLALAAAVAICESEPEALPSDDECGAGAAECALSHLQLRAIRERRSQESSVIPLSAAVFGKKGIRLAVSVSPVAPDGTVLPAQLLELDSGSSTMAFCKSGFSDTVAKEAITVNKTKIVACNMYAPDETPVGFWGFFYQGSLQIGQPQSPLVVSSAFYSVMQVQEGMPCNDDFQGIFGIAYGGIDQGYAYSPDMKDWVKEGVDAACPDQTMDNDIVPPIMQVLQGSAGPKLFGIHWSGELGAKAGELYLHGAATANDRYTGGKVLGQAALGHAGWYTIGVEQITLSSGAAVSVKGAGGPWKDIDCSEEGGDACLLDTESPTIIVPQDVMTAIYDLSNSSSPMGTISFTLAEASGGAPVELTFDVQTLLAKDWLAAGDGTDIVLGLPTWAFYYTVIDVESNAATFVANAAQRERLRPV